MKFNILKLALVMLAASNASVFAVSQNGKTYADEIVVKNDTGSAVTINGKTIQPGSADHFNADQSGVVEVKSNGNNYSLLYATYSGVRPELAMGTNLDAFIYNVSDIANGFTNEDNFSYYNNTEQLTLQ